MNEEIVKNYEADFKFFCTLAASAERDGREYNLEACKAICKASYSAFKLAANQMLCRLELMDSRSYPYIGLGNRSFVIDKEIEKIHQKRGYHEQKT